MTSLEAIFESIDELSPFDQILTIESGIGRNGERAKKFGHRASEMLVKKSASEKAAKEAFNRGDYWKSGYHDFQTRKFDDMFHDLKFRGSHAAMRNQHKLQNMTNPTSKYVGDSGKKQVKVQDHAMAKAKAAKEKDRVSTYDRIYDKGTKVANTVRKNLTGNEYDEDIFNKNKYSTVVRIGDTSVRDDKAAKNAVVDMHKLKSLRGKQNKESQANAYESVNIDIEFDNFM